jgi:chromate transporter
MGKRYSTLWKVFTTFLKIGGFTFGGGYAMIPLIQKETVENHKWITDEDILEIIAIAESTPGPIAINAATFVGYRTCGVLGSVCATLGVVLPSFVIILIVAKCYDKFRESSIVKGCMSGLKPAVVGLIGGAILSVLVDVFFPAGLSWSVLQAPSFYLSAGIFAVMLVLAMKKVHPIMIVVLSAVAGIGIGYLNLW